MLERLWHLVSSPFRPWAEQHSPARVSCDASSAIWNAWSTCWQPLAAAPSWCECFECPGCSSHASLPTAELCMQALHTLDLTIYDEALARVGEVTPDVCQIEDLVTSAPSHPLAKPAPLMQMGEGMAGAAGRMDTPASSTSSRLASTSPSTKHGKQREGHGPAAVDKRRRRTERPRKLRRLTHPRRRTLRTSAGYASETEIKEVHVHGAAAHCARLHLSTP